MNNLNFHFNEAFCNGSFEIVILAGIVFSNLKCKKEGFKIMEIWKRNLIVCWFGMFVTNVGMSQIAPVLPLYIRHLGIENTALIEQFSGFAFGVTFLVSAIFSPIWGQAADKYGRKPMLLRASLGMSIVIFLMGFVHSIYQFIGLRILQGVITGYSTACTTLIATQTNKENAGGALGTLSTSSIAGALIGPMIGGYISEKLGMQYIFFITGALMMVAFITTLLFVQEDFNREDKKVVSTKDIWNSIPHKDLTIVLIVTFFVLAVGLYSIEPIVTVYVGQLSKDTSHIALIAGIAFSASGLANIIAAPILGKLSDKVGPEKVILVALSFAGIVFIPQAFVTNPWQLMVLRFMLGLALGGMMPSGNSLVKRITPDNFAGRVFGFMVAAQYFGVFAGSILGGQIAAYMGIRYVFFVTSALVIINTIWIYFSLYRKMAEHGEYNLIDE